MARQLIYQNRKSLRSASLLVSKPQAQNSVVVGVDRGGRVLLERARLQGVLALKSRAVRAPLGVRAQETGVRNGIRPAVALVCALTIAH